MAFPFFQTFSNFLLISIVSNSNFLIFWISSNPRLSIRYLSFTIFRVRNFQLFIITTSAESSAFDFSIWMVGASFHKDSKVKGNNLVYFFAPYSKPRTIGSREPKSTRDHSGFHSLYLRACVADIREMIICYRMNSFY